MLKYFLYSLYNTVALLIIFFVLFYMNTYVNDKLIPAFLKKSFATEMIIRFLIAAIEGILLIFFIRQLNKRYLLQSKTTNVVAWTTIIEVGIVIIVCAVMFYLIFQQDK